MKENFVCFKNENEKKILCDGSRTHMHERES